MDGSFGSRLRSQREQQQVPLSVIAERTKIKVSLLDALERDDLSQWPAGIFRRSFVRGYAQAIGLDGDAVVREFLELYPEPVAEEPITAALVAAREKGRPPTRLGYLISSAIGALPVLVSGARGRSASPVSEALDAPVAAAHGPEAVAASIAAPDMPDMSDGPVDLDTAGYAAPLFLDRAATGIPAASGDALYDMAEAEDRPEPQAPMMLPLEDFEEPMALAGDLQAEDRVGPCEAGIRDDRPCLSEVADLCTRLARAMQPRDVTPVLEDAARVLDAVGLIVWMWDPATRTLGHVLAHGYSSDVLARLPRVRWDTDNAIAEAFRCGDARVVSGSGTSTGAVVVPIVTAAGCTGVLAMELQDRGEERDWVRAVASILAAQLAALFGLQTLAEAVGA